MKRLAREVGFAVLAWLIPFAVSVCIFPLKAEHEPLFDTLMGVTLTCSTIALAVIYFRRLTANYVAHGARIGITWAIANWIFDGLMFSSGPMKMSLNQYLGDIGIAYLAIPVMTIGLGMVASRAADIR
jgi:hypothetical protein